VYFLKLQVVVQDKIIDATGFLDDHPGGKKAILLYKGRDATEEFLMLVSRCGVFVEL